MEAHSGRYAGFPVFFWFVGSTHQSDRRLCRRAMKDEAHAAELDDVAVAELSRSADPHASDERAVLAPEVADHAGVVGARNRSVTARHG